MSCFTPTQAENIGKWLQQLRESVHFHVEEPIRKKVRFASTPAEIVSLYTQCNKLEAIIASALKDHSTAPVCIDDGFRPLVKLALLSSRRYMATVLDDERRRTVHLGMIASLDERLAQYEELMNEDWFEKISPATKPRLTDFLPIGQVEAALGGLMSLPSLRFDEKFQVLQAPTLLLPHLEYYRQSCALRGTSVAIAYIDIDNFKERFNSRYGETVVDRNVLPRFMARLEAFVFGRGHAYRYGGDEYALLLPTMDQPEAEGTLDRLRLQLSKLEYPDVSSKTTVSVGLSVIDPECFLTDCELEHSAERAKNFAKGQGKNRIATYATDKFRDKDLFICRPVSGEP